MYTYLLILMEEITLLIKSSQQIMIVIMVCSVLSELFITSTLQAFNQFLFILNCDCFNVGFFCFVLFCFVLFCFVLFCFVKKTQLPCNFQGGKYKIRSVFIESTAAYYK